MKVDLFFWLILLPLIIISIPFLKGLVYFGASIFLISVGLGITNTAIPSLLSLMSSQEKQGSILGLTQSVGSISRIPGPFLSGLATEYFGLEYSFLFGGLILIIPFLLGCIIFRICTLEGLTEILRALSC